MLSTQIAAIFGDQDISKCLHNLFLTVLYLPKCAVFAQLST